MSAGFAIKGLDHVVLRVADIGRALGFYCEVLGCRVERRVESIGLVQLRAGASLIDLVPATEPPGSPGSGPGGNMDHLCLRIEPFDEAGLRRHLAGHGIEVDEVAERYGADGTGPSMYIADPDGNTVELKGPPTRAPKGSVAT